MGNSTSDFQQQFFKLYTFIDTIDHPYFKSTKIYRKLRHNFNHIMIAQLPLIQVPTLQVSYRSFLTQRLGMIRRFQNRFTVQLEYFHLLEENKFQCGAPMIRMYIDYYNYTLMDYLSALRMKRQTLALDQLILVVQCLAEGILTLRKMGMDCFRITLSTIFLVIQEGVVLLNPVYLLYQSFAQAYNARTLHSLTQEFQLLKTGEKMELELQQKAQLRSLVMELTRYLGQQSLAQSQHLLRTLDKCSTIHEVTTVFVSGIDELNVQQFGESPQQSPALY